MNTRTVLTLTMVLAITSAILAQDEQRRERRPRPAGDQLEPRSPRPGGEPRERPEPGDKGEARVGGQGSPQRYSLEQAMSDNAQLHTIAFSGLAFITGDFGDSTFIPPGKVCDYFGFQYMRDIDAAQKGHNPMFLNRIVANVFSILTDAQRAEMKALAEKQAEGFHQIAYKRFPLIQAFHREADGQSPAPLNKAKVATYVGEIFAMDMALSYERAALFGKIARSLTTEQKAALAKLKFGDFNTWPDKNSEEYKLPRGTEKMVNVAYMTFGSEFFSWYAGSVTADVYFCPERHGTYFGGFYMKDMPAMGKKDFDISTSVTGDSGKEFINTLTELQKKEILAIPNLQRKALTEVAQVRKSISEELRLLLAGKKADTEKLMALGTRYGELDGEMSYYYATAFARVKKTLSEQQKAALMKLRNLEGYTSAPAYLYSTPLKELPPLKTVNLF